MKQKLLIFDTNWLAYRARFSLPTLSKNEQPTAIIFNIMGEIIKHCYKFYTKNICFAFDSKYSKRRDIYRYYKFKRIENRTQKSEEEKELDQFMYNQIDQLRKEILTQLGFNNIWYQNGYENDDTISNFCLNNSDKYDIIVVAGDKDFYQILDHCDLYKNIKKKWQLYTSKHLMKELGVTPSQWLEGKYLFGCSSDCVPGITGVKEKTACKYVLGKMNPNTKTFKKIEHRKDFYINRNKELVGLPLKSTKLFEFIEDELGINNFDKVCEEFGFISYLNGDIREKWLELFCDGEEQTLGMKLR